MTFSKKRTTQYNLPSL